MANKQLLDYVNGQLQLGTPRDQIVTSLVSNGWQASDVAETFNFIDATAAPTLAVTPTPSTPTSHPEPQQTQTAIGQIAPLQQSRVLSVIVTVIAGAVLLTGGAFAAYTISNQSPESVILRMLQANTKLTAVEYTGELLIEGTTREVSQDHATDGAITDFSFSFDFNGKMDFSDQQNPVGQFALNLHPNLYTDMFTGGSPVNFEARIPGNDQFYLKVNGLPAIFNLNTLNNQWINFVLKDLAEQYAPEDITEKINELEDETLTPKQIKQLWQAAFDTGYFTFAKTPRSEPLRGKSVHHFQFTLDTTALEEFVQEAEKILADSPVAQEMITDFKELPGEMTPSITSGELWIGKTDFLLYQLKINTETGGDSVPKELDQISLKMEFSNHNEPVEVEVPPNARNIEEIIEGLFGGFGNEFESTNMNGLESNFQPISDSTPLMWLQNLQRSN